MRRRRSIMVLAIGALLNGCGTEDPPAIEDPVASPTPPVGEVEPARLHPLAVGASWSYRVTDEESGAFASKLRVVEAFEDIGDRKAGIEGFRMRIANDHGSSVSWHEDRGPGVGVVRHREMSLDAAGVVERDEFYETSKLRVDESPAHVVVGAAWIETYTELTLEPGLPEETSDKTRHWSVEAAETVTVPAGTFETIRVRRVSPSGGTDKTFWFAEGIGPIKEWEPGVDLLELEAWSIP